MSLSHRNDFQSRHHRRNRERGYHPILGSIQTRQSSSYLSKPFSDVIETMQDENLIPKSNYPDLTQRNPVTYRAPLASNTAENNISTTRQIGKSPNVLATRVRRERSRQEFPIENF